MIRKLVYVGGREFWRLMMHRPAQRGTTSEVVSRYIAAVVMGLVSWWAYTHR